MALTFAAFGAAQHAKGKSWKGVTIFPLRGEDAAGPDYLVGVDAIEKNLIRVAEVSDSGTVQTISVENLSDQDVLLVEGETLEGAKQNRTLNTTVLIASHSKINIPVSCVEAGRWRHSSAGFASGKHYSHSKLRRLKSRHTTETLRHSLGFAGDQGFVWQEIAAKEAQFHKRSPTAAVDVLYDRVTKDQEELAAKDPRDSLPDFSELLEGARGMVLMSESKHFIVDLFDKRSTFERYKDRLVRAAIFEAVSAQEASSDASPDRAAAFLDRASNMTKPERRPSPGLGTDVRATGDGILSVSLEIEGTPVHTAAYTLADDDVPRSEFEDD